MPKAKTEKTKSARNIGVNRFTLVVLAVTFIVLGFFILSQTGNSSDCSQKYRKDKSGTKLVVSSNELFDIEFASTDQQRTLGLSGRSCIGLQQVMIFEFQSPGKYGFWMKDMNFAIDIVWLDQNKKVVSVVENAVPSSYPQIFVPEETAMYVVEMQAGKTRSLNIQNGQFLNW